MVLATDPDVLVTEALYGRVYWGSQFQRVSIRDAGVETVGLATEQQAQSLLLELQAGSQQSKPGMVCSFETPKPTLSDVLPSANPRPLSLPIQRHQLRSRPHLKT